MIIFLVPDEVVELIDLLLVVMRQSVLLALLALDERRFYLRRVCHSEGEGGTDLVQRKAHLSRATYTGIPIYMQTHIINACARAVAPYVCHFHLTSET